MIKKTGKNPIEVKMVDVQIKKKKPVAISCNGLFLFYCLCNFSVTP